MPGAGFPNIDPSLPLLIKVTSVNSQRFLVPGNVQAMGPFGTFYGDWMTQHRTLCYSGNCLPVRSLKARVVVFCMRHSSLLFIVIDVFVFDICKSNVTIIIVSCCDKID